jgi:hypothetical protein
MLGDEIRRVSLDAVDATWFAAFGDFGTDDFDTGGLADFGFGQKSTGIDAG